MGKYINIDDLSKTLSSKNRKVVLVHGVFDILHAGHIQLLLGAKKLGDLLVVGLDVDENAKIIKGEHRPYNKFNSRLSVLEQINPIDYIFCIPSLKDVRDKQEFFTEIYLKIKPDIIATNINAGKHGVLKQERAEKLGIKFKTVGDVYKNKPTDYIDSIVNK